MAIETIQIKRGLKANLPRLAEGELALTRDTYDVFIGTANGNIQAFNPNLTTQVNTNTLNIQTNTTNIAANTSQLADMVTDVKLYGAKGDGVTDDTTAIQNAINFAVTNKKGIVFFPVGTYLITQSLNLTNITYGLELVGVGMGLKPSDLSTGGTTILGKTGGIILDRSGSRYLKVKKMRLYSDGSSGCSTIGILDTRSTVMNYAEFNGIDEVTIQMPSIPSANGGQGTIGIYNYGAELAEYEHVYIMADRTICIVASNIYSISSPYATLLTGQQSMSEIKISGSLIGYAKNGIRLDNTVNLNFDNVYILMGGAQGPNNNFAFECTNTIVNLYLTGHVESYNGLIDGIGAWFQGLYVKITKQIMAAYDQIVLDATSARTTIIGGSIDIVPMLNFTISNTVINQIGSNQNGVINCDIKLYSYQNISIPYGTAQGTTIRVQDEAHTSINIPPTSANMGLVVLKPSSILMPGLLVTGPIQLGYVTSLPTASANYENQILILEGNGTSTASILYVCLKSATGTFSWKQVVSG